LAYIQVTVLKRDYFVGKFGQFRFPIGFLAVLRIHMFLGLQDPDPDPLVRGMGPDPDPALDPDPSIVMQK
jgi:hypothetical protein